MGHSWRSWFLALCLPPACALAGESVDAWTQLASLDPSTRAAQVGRSLSFEVDLRGETSPGFSIDAGTGARYRMAYNNIAEGWSWQPDAAPAEKDYYRYKYLPLESVTVDRGAYDNPNPFDGTHRIAVRWRYDYFVAFDNLYDFYPRSADEEAGFAATLPPGARAPLRMRATIRVTEPVTAESTTYWRATPDKREDFTLKKRYVFGRLEAVSFLDADGKTLAILRPTANPQ